MSESISQSSLRIFICYRRDDSAGYTRHLFEKLSAQFGAGQVFMDIEQIEPGADFGQVIEDAVGACDILLAVIGRRWLVSTDGNIRRLDNPDDFVRLEIVTALNLNLRVIPVLVEGATMPIPSNLPDDLFRLSRRNAFELSDRRWNYDVNRLISALEKSAILPRTLVAAVETIPISPGQKLLSIISPLTGTFFRAPRPAGDPFVQVGSRVEPDTIVGIIESMKLMNEVRAEMSGIVEVVYVENAQLVDDGQPLFGIKALDGIKALETNVVPPPAPEPPAESSAELEIIRSPLVGIFYRSPSPSANALVRIGSTVEPETVVCIIEAMKLMNELLAEVSGTVEKVYVENGQPVEYGQPLFGVRK